MKVENHLIEYFGLTGDFDYDKNTELKLKVCEKFNIPLIAIYPSDLNKLDDVLNRFI